MSTTNSNSNHSEIESTDNHDHECPSCTRTFDSDHGVKIHHAQVHDESLVETTTCDHCGREFRPHPESAGKYCSPACDGAARVKRATLECDECGETFECRYRDRDRRRFCSPACASSDRRDRVTLECAQCERSFWTHQCNSDQAHCCPSCRYEAQRTTPREFDSVDELLTQLYVDEGFNLDKTYRRQRAVLGEEDALYKKTVRERLVEMGVFEHTHHHRLQQADPDAIGGPEPDGDDSWRQFYANGGAADD